MMAVLWNDIERGIALCRRHFGRAVELFRRGWNPEDPHSALLNRIAEPSLASSRPALLDSKDLLRTADRLRAFRHVAAHNYENFDEERAEIAVRAAEVFLAEMGPALTRFRAIIDPD